MEQLDLAKILDNVSELIQYRLRLAFNPAAPVVTFPQTPMDGALQRFVAGMSKERHDHVHAYYVLALALVPHIDPGFYDRVIQESLPEAGDFPQLGGARGKNFRGFLPTGETALFLLGGMDFAERRRILRLFNAEHFLGKRRILWLEEAPEGEPRTSGRIVLSQDYVDLFLLGKVTPPRFSMFFPAERIETAMEWEDLVLDGDTLNQVRELETWIKHGHTLLYNWGMSKRLRPGYRVLFYGPPGTGKTLTATLLGKYTNKPVYRIDLSMVISKYIGETEKNLSNLFAKAENKDWILFFDEADALFGKRTNVRDAHDKYANQEVSYLLQRVENYNGLVILATNMRSNIDEAFCRRFQSIIPFPAPNSRERLQLWSNAFPQQIQLHREINLGQIAQQYKLTGAEIMNISQYCCLQSMESQNHTIRFEDIERGIRREFAKEGKMVQ